LSARIARMAARHEARLLYVSTDSVFDGLRGDYRETDPPGPVNTYARTKLHGEQVTLDHNPSATICRVNFYGWKAQSKRSLAEWILEQLARGEVVRGFTDVFFCPIFTGDLSEILLAMLDQDLRGLFHVVGSERVSKYEFARRVAASFGFDAHQVIASEMAEAKLKAPRPRDTSLNTEKICAALRRPMPDVDSGLSRFIQSRDSHTGQLKSCLTGVRE
jgi:dTDP-4-dehydrorhamnose reductase